MMKIGFDAKRAYQNYTGLGNYSRDLLKNLFETETSNEYFLYAPKITRNPNLKFLSDHQNVNLVAPITQLDKTFKGLWRSVNLEKTLQKDGIDIFHGLSNEIPRRSSNSKVKYIVTIHDLIFKRYPRNYKAIDRGIYNTKFKYACKNADQVIAISQQTKSDIVEFYGVSPSKINVLYQTCHKNFKKDYASEIKQEVTKKFDLPEDFILNVGTVETRKNLYVLLQACQHMKNDLPIVVVGRKTKYFNFLKVQMQKLKIDTNRFIFLKNVSMEELPLIYQSASVFVYPSYFEGFGIPIIEALHSNVPCITTQGGCFSEAGGPSSKYIDPSNAEEVANTIDLVLENSSLRNEMIITGKKYVEKFEPELLTNQLVEIYSKLS